MATPDHAPLRLPEKRDLLIRRAIAADDGCVSVAGLAVALGMLPDHADASPRATPGAHAAPASSPAALQALGRFVQLARRRAGLSSEDFAAQAHLDLREILDLESGLTVPEPRVLYRLSAALSVSYEKLLILAGHRQQRDDALEREALRFAAHSGSMAQLSKTESEALHDFIRVLDH